MYEKWKKYTVKHPYLSIVLIVIFSSIVGITFEFIKNGVFIGEGLYVVIFMIVLQFLLVRKSQNK